MTNPLRDVFDTQQMRATARVALAEIEDSSVEITAIEQGNRKQTALARFATRGPVIVQLCTERTWLRTEAMLLNAVRQRTFVPVPPVLAAGSHNGVAYMLTAYVPGEELHKRFTAVGDSQRCELARWFGRALARLHETFTFEGYGQLTCSKTGLVAAHDDWATWFQAYGTRAIRRLPAEFDPLREELQALFAAVPEDAPKARLFPWDFRPGNALVADGSVTAVLDWEAPLAAVPALSVAKSEYLVADWYVDEPEPLRRSFREGYSSIREFPAVRPAHRAAAIAASAVDSQGVVTNPRYPPVGRDDAVAFHRTALQQVIAVGEQGSSRLDTMDTT